MAERMKKTRLSFRKSRWQKSDANEIKPDYNNAFTVLGVLLTELANAAAAVLLTVCAVSVVNTTVSHVRCVCVAVYFFGDKRLYKQAYIA